MVHSLDVAIEHQLEEYTQFLGRNFDTDGWSDALYRMSLSTVSLPRPPRSENLEPKGSPTISVPGKLLVMVNGGEWKQHPVVFLHYDYIGRYMHGSLNFFLPDRKLIRIAYDGWMGQELDSFYDQAKRRSLTQGVTTGIQMFSRED